MHFCLDYCKLKYVNEVEKISNRGKKKKDTCMVSERRCRERKSHCTLITAVYTRAFFVGGITQTKLQSDFILAYISTYRSNILPSSADVTTSGVFVKRICSCKINNLQPAKISMQSQP